jgi:ankyrin repeat protein
MTNAPNQTDTIDEAINRLPQSMIGIARESLTRLELLNLNLLINADGQGINRDLTPMIICCGYGNYIAVVWLRMIGANCTTTCKNGEYFPLGIAASNCHLQICKFLFINGAQEDINRENQYGDTPLSMSFCNFDASPTLKFKLSCWILINGGGSFLSGNAVRVFRTSYGSINLLCI